MSIKWKKYHIYYKRANHTNGNNRKYARLPNSLLKIFCDIIKCAWKIGILGEEYTFLLSPLGVAISSQVLGECDRTHPNVFEMSMLSQAWCSACKSNPNSLGRQSYLRSCEEKPDDFHRDFSVISQGIVINSLTILRTERITAAPVES